MAEKISEYETRRRRLELLQEAGIEPYPAQCQRKETNSQVLANFQAYEKSGEVVYLAGRLRSLREHGNLTFADLQDGTATIQLAFSKKELGDSYKNFLKFMDIGDFVAVSGPVFRTHAGEPTVLVKEWQIISKALRPLPEKWHGLKDEDERWRKRYLDLLFNDDLRVLFVKKAQFWQVTRQFMLDHGFLEVETPTLEITTGGAEANPFKTHYNDYDIDVYLRISVGELWQKRLMAAAFDKTFEIGRVFRNEGSSPDHLQEFTNMEFYWAYANYLDGMKLSRELYVNLAQQVFGTTKFNSKGYSFDLAGEWPELGYCGEIKRQTGIDVLEASDEMMRHRLDELGVNYEGTSRERLIDTLWKYCRRNIAGPAFVVGHPKLVSPLAKSRSDNPELTERFQIIIAGTETGNGYSELNNPLEQQARFQEQQKLLERGDTEAMMPDWDFIEMLEYGMPPTCGFGFGERFFACLAGRSVREATLFPFVKPKVSSK